jgi:hypothetical protein
MPDPMHIEIERVIREALGERVGSITVEDTVAVDGNVPEYQIWTELKAMIPPEEYFHLLEAIQRVVDEGGNQRYPVMRLIVEPYGNRRHV